VVQVAVMAGVETVHHHGTHRPLIWPADESVQAEKVDAIIVPTARQVPALKEAAKAALALGCPLVTLHSGKWTSAYAAAAQLDPAIDLIAIDVPRSAHLRLPELETSRLLAGTKFERWTDVSTKRNLALVLGHMLRWKRVVFLDDDIRVPNPADLGKAVRSLDTHAAVGLYIGGFPDNSMVCHAFREAGGWQETFIGGGAMAVEIKRHCSFFPNVYNEDWFFVLEAGKRLHSVATVGQVLQNRYDPYRVERARGEELGDVLAEGTFWLLDQGKPASDGDLDHWRDFLGHRRQFITDVQAMVAQAAGIDATVRIRMGEALRAALGRSASITPELCVAYMKALAIDQEQWQRHIQQIRRQPKLSREQALSALTLSGGTPLTWYTRKSTSARETGARSARKRPPLGTPAPAWRPIRVGEFQAPVAPAPPAWMPRQLSAAGASSSRRALALEMERIALACGQRHGAVAGQVRER
jgi:hypothetical protein